MNNEQIYYDDGGGVDTAVVRNPFMGLSTVEPAIAVGLPATRAERKLAHRAGMDATREHHKTNLVKNLIYNTVVTSAMVDAAAAMVPTSEPVCRDIVRVAALSSVKRISEEW